MVTNPGHMSSSSLTNPIVFSGGIPTIWSMSYLNLQSLPILDASKPDRLKWLNTHTSMVFSKRESNLRTDPSLSTLEGERTRLNFKASLFSLFMHFSGLQGRREYAFGLNNPTDGGIHILLFVSSLRIDLSNRTVALDVAALPICYTFIPEISAFMASLTDRGFRSIKVDDAELRLWKRVLPACAERCRTWTHRTSCEYVAAGRAPLSSESGQAVFCQCSSGVLTDDFHVDVLMWSRCLGTLCG